MWQASAAWWPKTASSTPGLRERGAVRHGFFAVNVLARAHRVYDHLLVPVIGYGRDNAVDVFIGKQFVIPASDRKIRLVCNLASQGVTSVIEIAGCDAYH